MLTVTNDPTQICRALAKRARQLRIDRGWTQVELARRAGVAYSTLKHFEHTGQIALKRLVMVALALSAVDAFETLLRPAPASSLAEIEARQVKRQRGLRATR